MSLTLTRINSLLKMKELVNVMDNNDWYHANEIDGLNEKLMSQKNTICKD